MNRTGLWIRTGVIVAITLIGVYLVFGPRRTPTTADLTWSGIKNNLATNINLGLDLKGGSHLVMRVKTEEYLKKLTQNNQLAAQQAAKDAKDESGQPYPIGDAAYIAQNGDFQLNINVNDPSKAQAVSDAIKKKVDFSAWTETINGGTINWALSKQAQAKLKDQATDQALKIIDSRINAFG